MILSDLIKKLETKLAVDGDCHLRKVELDYLEFTEVHRLLSPTRKTKTGQRAFMSLKEFEIFCMENPIPKNYATKKKKNPRLTKLEKDLR